MAAVAASASTAGSPDMTTTTTTSDTAERDWNLTAVTDPASLQDYHPLMTVEQSLFALRVIQHIKHVLGPVSFLCTLVNIVVFYQKSMRGSSAYVLAISQAQIVYVVISFYNGLVPASFTMPTYGHMFVLFYLGVFVNVVLLTGNYLVMCLLAAERLYAVLRPLHVREFVLAKRPVLYAGVAFFTTAVGHTHLILKYRVREIHVPGTGSRYTLFITSTFRQNEGVLTGMGTAAKILFSYLPLVVLIILNVSTVLVLRRHSLDRRTIQMTSNDAERREHQMTLTVVSVTVCYVILSLPLALCSTIASLVPEFGVRGRESSVYFVVEDFASMCILLSCATDFVCFVSLSSAYRNTCVRLFPLKRAGAVGDSGNIANSTVSKVQLP